MNLKDKFLAFIDIFENLGKEVLAFTCLFTGFVLLLKGFLNGSQFVDLVRGVGIAYISGATVGNCSDSILAHLKDKATALVREKL